MAPLASVTVPTMPPVDIVVWQKAGCPPTQSAITKTEKRTIACQLFRVHFDIVFPLRMISSDI